MSHEIARVTACRLCPKKFYGPSFTAAALIGQDKNAKLDRWMKELALHVATEHTKENDVMQLQALEYLGLLRMLNYSTQDPELGEQIDFLRWRTHQATLAARVPDDKIKEKCHVLSVRLIDELFSALPEVPYYLQAMRHALIDKLNEAITAHTIELRDLLEEPGKYVISEIVPAANGQKPH
jgi:hypothetical protein